ncbi:hypothetical protein IWX65_001060 [Arthrobacter sp. CAN_A214]|uniref:arylsulfotransferase family protein n=1 Tax=Arthrobacter sp. CAN_A214 TaxID=2787720 RepID=UPI0018CAB728
MTTHRKRGLPRLAAICTVALTATACTIAEGDTQQTPSHSYASRPDLAPPVVALEQGEAWEPDYGTSEELIFLTPGFPDRPPTTGGLVLDASGEPVWINPADPDDSQDDQFELRVQEYQGEPVLTLYQGSSGGGYGDGTFTILNRSYEEIASVTTGGDLAPGNADFHDSTITPRDTMLISAYEPAEADLSELGGPTDGWVEEAVIQEIDIATGDVLFEWRSLDHIPVADSIQNFGDALDGGVLRTQDFDKAQDENEVVGTEESPFDYLHVNSIAEDDDGILVSARHTSAIYRIDRATGELDWTLGGTANDFELGDGAEFSWQHDARRSPDGTLTLFDNASNENSGDNSRGLRLQLDEEAMTAAVVTEYLPPEDRTAGSMANTNELPNGNILISWGAQPFYSEFTADGALIYDVSLGGDGSYRAYKSAWQGQPATPPDVVVQENDGGSTAYVSWNGATGVAQWRLLTGADEATATEGATVDRESFETEIPLPEDAAYVAVQALDASGNELGTGVAD